MGVCSSSWASGDPAGILGCPLIFCCLAPGDTWVVLDTAEACTSNSSTVLMKETQSFCVFLKKSPHSIYMDWTISFPYV